MGNAVSASDLRLFVFIIAMFFLFHGDPDVWDSLHAIAISAANK